MQKRISLALFLLMAVSTLLSAQAAPVTLKIFWWGSQDRHDKTLRVLDLYKASHPNVTFEPTFQGYDGYFNKLAIMAAANEMPDIVNFYVNAGDTDQFIYKGLLEPLDQYVTKKIIDVTTISPTVLSLGKQRNVLYGMPLGINAKAMMVDVDLYKKAGLAVPAEGYPSWQAMTADLVKLKAVTGAYGADDPFDVNFMLTYFTRQNGQSEFSATGIGFDEKTYTAYIELRKDWIKKGLIPTLDITMLATSPEQSNFAKGKAALTTTYSSQFGSFAYQANRNLALIGLPGPNREKGMDIRPGMHFSVSSKSMYKEEAAKFISWFVNDVPANKVLAAGRGMPISNKVLQSLDDTFTPGQKVAAAYLDKLTKASSPMDQNPPPGSAEIEKFITETNQKVLFDMISAKEAYKLIKEEASKIVVRSSAK